MAVTRESILEVLNFLSQNMGNQEGQAGGQNNLTNSGGGLFSNIGSSISSGISGFGNKLQGILGGTPGQQLTFDRFDSGQSDALSQLLKSGLEGLDFGAIESQARKGFGEETVPTLAERFTSLGQGSQQSSGFAQSLGQSGSRLESDLAAMKSQRGLQALGLGLTPKFDSIYSQRQPGFAEQGLKGILSSLPSLLRGGL